MASDYLRCTALSFVYAFKERRDRRLVNQAETGAAKENRHGGYNPRGRLVQSLFKVVLMEG